MLSQALYRERGDVERAQILAERALALVERAYQREHAAIAEPLDVLGQIYRDRGDLARAETYYLRAFAIREKTLRFDHPDIVSSLNGLAEVYREQGDSARAEPLLERGLSIREDALGPDHPAVATMLSQLARLYHRRGAFARAESLYRRALRIREAALSAKHPAVAESLESLAALFHDQSDYPRAESLYQRALAIREAALGSLHPNVASSLNHLAVLWRDRGDFARAERLLQRVLDIRKNALPASHPDIASTVDEMAELRMEQRDYQGAGTFYEQAFAIRTNALGTEHPDIARSVTNLARLHLAMGNLKRAEPLLERALEITEKALGPSHPAVATTLRYLAQIYHRRGDYTVAGPLYQRAISIQVAAFGTSHPAVVPVLYDVSSMSLAQGDVAAAIEAQARAVEVRNGHAALLLAAGAEAQKQAYMATLARETSETISLHLHHAPSNSAAARLALTTILDRKVRALDAMTEGLALLRGRLRPDDQRVLDDLASVQAELANLTMRGAVSIPIERQMATAVKLQQRRETLEADVSRRSAEFRVLRQPVQIEQVQASIPQEAALVEFIVYAPFDIKAAISGPPPQAPRLAAYVLDSEGHVRFTDLGDLEPIEAAVRDLLHALAHPAGDPKPAARALDARIMQPVRALLGTTRAMLLSPDGVLNLVPFGALVDESGAYLVESMSFTYLTSGRDLLRTRVPRPTPKEGAVVVANPDFGDPLVVSKRRKTGAGRRSFDMKEMALAGANRRSSHKEDGILTALEAAGLDLYGTRLVVLSACYTGVGEARNGDGVYGLRRAFVLAGAETQVISLWKVDDQATRALMAKYYRALLDNQGRSEAMRTVQHAMLGTPEWQHPYYWAGFIVSGDGSPLNAPAQRPNGIKPNGCCGGFDKPRSTALPWQIESQRDARARGSHPAGCAMGPEQLPCGDP